MSIGGRLLLLVVVATLVPTLLLSGRFVVDRERQVVAAAGELSAAAAGVADDLHDRILGTTQLLYGLGRARDLDSRDRKACSAFLSDVREEHPQYTGILTIDPDGRLFCDSLGTGRDLDLRDRDYFQRASAPNGGLAIQAAFGRLTGLAVLQIAYPARQPSGDLKFVLLASLNLGKFAQDRAPPRGELLIVDRAGTVLARTPAVGDVRMPGVSIAGRPLFVFASGRETIAEVGDEDPWIWTTARTPALEAAGVHVLVGQPKRELVQAANRALGEDIGVLALVALVLFVGVWLLADFGIRRQVDRIGTMVKKLAAGDLSARIASPHPGGELGGLMATLNETVQSLQNQRQEIEALDARLRQSQKMEAVGQLTGGVAHDFNNLLTVILGNAEALVDQLADRPELARLAEMNMAAAERGADLTRSLLAFARRQPLDPRAVDVNRLASGMEGILRRTLGEHVECRFVLGVGIAKAMIDPTQLESAILNLALNARDAMPEGGALTIETADAHLDEAYARENAEAAPGAYVMVAVADSGLGMDAETVARAFEPFFTTKGVGKGTGLGLSMVYGFVKQSRGHVKIYSEVGHGTIVKLYLPRADATADVAAPRETETSFGRGEVVLAVEDDDMVRAHVENELRILGYQVLTAANGVQALAVLRAAGSIDLLFTDVVMPGGLSGPQLAREATGLRPGLKVLYTSGYTENAVVHHGRLDPGVLLLNKPYRRQDLARKLREALGAP